jgi:hypothetical protein
MKKKVTPNICSTKYFQFYKDMGCRFLGSKFMAHYWNCSNPPELENYFENWIKKYTKNLTEKEKAQVWGQALFLLFLRKGK